MHPFRGKISAMWIQCQVWPTTTHSVSRCEVNTQNLGSQLQMLLFATTENIPYPVLLASPLILLAVRVCMTSSKEGLAQDNSMILQYLLVHNLSNPHYCILCLVSQLLTTSVASDTRTPRGQELICDFPPQQNSCFSKFVGLSSFV